MIRANAPLYQTIEVIKNFKNIKIYPQTKNEFKNTQTE